MNRDLSVKSPTEAPTRLRYGVLGFACALSMITYLDRVCFSKAPPHLQETLGLTSIDELKWAFWAFTFAYAAFEVPSGWLGDVFGPRRTLIRIVLWWSFFTAITGFIGLHVGGLVLGGLGTLVVVRFLFGMGEAGAYPNITRALHNWFPVTGRAVAQGAVWMSGRLMGGLTPLIWWLMIDRWGVDWRDAFWIFGALGVAWCVLFAFWFRNRPEEKEGVNEGELALIGAGRADREPGHKNVPWGRLLRSGNLWAVCLMYFCAAYGWYFNITYLPTFLEELPGYDPKSAWGPIYQGGPLWMGAVGCLLGGFLSDRFIRQTGNLKWGRRLFGVMGHGLCALCYLGCLAAPNDTTFFLAISIAAFWNDMTMGASWAVCQDIGKRYAAIVAGCMNTVGNLGGSVANLVTGYIIQYNLSLHAEQLGLARGQLDKTQVAAGSLPGYHVNFVIFGCVYLVAVLLWFRIDATKPVIPDEEPPAAEAH